VTARSMLPLNLQQQQQQQQQQGPRGVMQLL
jgi:hypothetical protein